MNGCTISRLSAAELEELAPAERAAVLAMREAFRGVDRVAAIYRAAGYVSVGRKVEHHG